MTLERACQVGRNMLLNFFFYGFPVLTMMFILHSIVEGRLLESLFIYLLTLCVVGSGFAILVYFEGIKAEKRKYNVQLKKRNESKQWIQTGRVLKESTIF